MRTQMLKPLPNSSGYWFGGHTWGRDPQGAFTVTAGSQYCAVDADGCATDGNGDPGAIDIDGPGEHGDHRACTIRVNHAGTLTATEFDVESHSQGISPTWMGVTVYMTVYESHGRCRSSSTQFNCAWM